MKKRTPLKRGQPPRRKKPLRSSNAKRQARRKAAYARYMHSAAWRTLAQAVRERDDNRCTRVVQIYRCPATTRLTVHHKTYARFGHERLEDLTTLCWSCHQIVDADKPNNRRRGKS